VAKRDGGAARHGGAGEGEEGADKRGPWVSERGGDEIRRRKPKRTTYFHEGANGSRARRAGWAEQWPAGEGWAGSAN
jgi:hypothetical protein